MMDAHSDFMAGVRELSYYGAMVNQLTRLTRKLPWYVKPQLSLLIAGYLFVLYFGVFKDLRLSGVA
jgi:hypothetical protein